MTVVNAIELQYAADTSDLQKDLAAATKSIDGFFKKTQTLGGSLNSLKDKIAGINPVSAGLVGVTVAVGVAFTKTFNAAVDYGNELQRISNRTGIAVEELSRLKFAAEQEDVSLQDVAGSLRIVSRQADAAAKGSKESSAAFARLGVEVKDANGNLKSGTVLLREIGEGLAKIPPGTERTAAGMAVLGRSAQAIIPLVTNLKALEARAEELGLTVSGKFGRDADEFGDRIDEIRSLAGRAGVSIASVFLPALNSLLAAFTGDAANGLKTFNESVGDLSFKVFKFANALIALKAQLDELGNSKLTLAINFSGAGRPDLAVKALRGEIGPTEAEIARLNKTFEDAAANTFKTRQEFDAMGKSLGTGEGLQGQVTTATEALDQLVKKLQETDQAIAPVVSLAESLAGTFPDLNPRFQELVQGLQNVANTGPEAALALQRVLAVAAQAREELSGELARSFEKLTGVGDGGFLDRRAPERRETGVQGPLTEAQSAGLGGPLEPSDTETLQAAPKLMEETATAAESIQAALLASDLAAEALNTTVAAGQGLISGFSNLAGGLTDALIETAEGGKRAFGDFFRGLLKSLASAIIRATILQAILGAFGGGFSLAKIGKNIQQLLGFGAVGFAHQESSILGRASQARGLEAVAGPSFAGGGTENVMSINRTPEIRVYEPGPFTAVEFTDQGVIPRMRTRRRRLNEEPF
jgi:hypothetical protein